MRESHVEDYLKRRAEAMGGEVRKLKWIGRRNAPDRIVCLPRSGFPCLVELKRPGLRATKAQQREHDRLRRVGMRVEVINSLASVDSFLGGST